MSEQTAENHTHAHCFCCEAGESFGRFFRSMGPSEEATNHFRQARIEFLKGIRRIIDDRIDHVSQSNKGAKITVE
jgi:hypothetical protein